MKTAERATRSVFEFRMSENVHLCVSFLWTFPFKSIDFWLNVKSERKSSSLGLVLEVVLVDRFLMGNNIRL